MAIEKDFFRQIMGRFATGVTVVTTSHQGALGGLTVNAFCSLSLNPPLILICVDLTSNTLPLIRESKMFAVNILTDKQEDLSRCFATHSEERFDRFCHAPYHIGATGAPILDDVLAFIDARVVAEYPGGDHAIFVGQVAALGTADHIVFADEADSVLTTLTGHDGIALEENNIPPLAYYRGQYRHLTDQYQSPSLTAYDNEQTSTVHLQ